MGSNRGRTRLHEQSWCRQRPQTQLRKTPLSFRRGKNFFYFQNFQKMPNLKKNKLEIFKIFLDIPISS